MTTPPPSQGPQLTDEERAFLEADTQQSIPVVHEPLPPHPPRLPWEAVLAGGAAVTVIAAMLVLYLAQQPSAPPLRAQGSSTAVPPDSTRPEAGDTVDAGGHEDGKGGPGPVPPALPAPPPVAPDPLPAPAPSTEPPGNFLPDPPGGAAAECVPVSFRTPGGTTACLSVAVVCAAGSPWHTPYGETVCGGPLPTQHIRVTTLPGQDAPAGSLHCLAWTDLGEPDGHGHPGAPPDTGGDSGTDGAGSTGQRAFRTADLLVDPPAGQCSAHLVGPDGLAYRTDGSSVFSSVPLHCESPYPGTRLTYPGVLESTADAHPPRHVCVSERVGT